MDHRFPRADRRLIVQHPAQALENVGDLRIRLVEVLEPLLYVFELIVDAGLAKPLFDAGLNVVYPLVAAPFVLVGKVRVRIPLERRANDPAELVGVLLESVEFGRAVFLLPLGDSAVVRDAAGAGRPALLDRLSWEVQRLDLGFHDCEPFDYDTLLEVAALFEPREFACHVRWHIVALRVEIGEIQDHGRFPRGLDPLG